VEGIIFGLIRIVIYLLRSASIWLKGLGSGDWPLADAIVADDPMRVGSTIEIVYSYRFEGELYTGLHEEPVFAGSGAEYTERFTKGRNFFVRVKPGEPEVSVVRDADQADGTQKRLEQIDERHRHG
jgi:hypothetical protein